MARSLVSERVYSYLASCCGTIKDIDLDLLWVLRGNQSSGTELIESLVNGSTMY